MTGNLHAFGTFLFLYKCRDWADAYTVALRLLGEQPAEQWTPELVIETVMRAVEREADV